MNYIKQLQGELNDAGKAVELALSELEQFRRYLLTASKFTGVEADGERRDWIATADVVRFIDQLRGSIVDAAPLNLLLRAPNSPINLSE